ncbi:MAG: IS1182 family transposase [Rikenellaceae bacterium]
MAKVAFKSDNQAQNLLIPPSFGDLVPATHRVRVVNSVLDRIDVSDLLQSYKGGGNSCFHPRMMLKILVYAYLNNIYSGRQIEQQLQENIPFMWLAGGAKPDFRTINYFRSKRLKDKFEDIFTQVVILLAEEGFVSLNVQYIDGTKIESAANKYTFVWRGSVEKNEARLKKKTHALLQQIEEAEGLERNDEVAPETLTSEDFKSRVERIKERMDSKPTGKRERNKVEKIERENIAKMEEYKEQLDTMGDRNSFSKTDKEATFMRMKEDAMGNGQLKPAYNVQISTENQFITNYGIYQRPGDTATLIPYLDSFEARFNRTCDEVVADAGYGSEQNYEYMRERGMKPYVKYNYFHKEQKRKARENIFHPNNLFYNADGDFYVCPMGQRMQRCGTSKKVSDLEYVSYSARYSAVRCEGCPLRGGCFKALGNRRIEVNHNLNKHKAYARELLTSQRGLYHRSMRPIEPEAVFGQIKAGHMFRRFALRSLAKVNVEFGLIAIAHNLRKWVASLANGYILTNCRRIFARPDQTQAISSILNQNCRIVA